MREVPPSLMAEFLSCSALAELLRVNAEQLRQWLRKDLLGSANDFQTFEDAAVNEPRIKWRVSAALLVVRRRLEKKNLPLAIPCPDCPFHHPAE